MKTRITIAALFGVCMATLVAQQNQAPAFPRAADALERVTWRTRTLVANDRLTNWDLADSRHGSHVPGIGREGRCRARAVRRSVEHAACEPAGSEEPRSQPDGRRDRRGQGRHGTERARQRVSRRQPAGRCGDAPQDLRTRAGLWARRRSSSPATRDFAGLDTLAEEFRVTSRC